MTNFTPEFIRRELAERIHKLPIIIDQDDPQGGVLRPWVRELPLRAQSALLTAIRGCDGAPKEDSSKSLNRMIRRAVLNPVDVRETNKAGGFFGFSAEKLEQDLMDDFFHSLDQYPLHYITHLMQACEVIGFMHPGDSIYTSSIKEFFEFTYRVFCFTLHVYPESKHQMILRLTEDRVALGTTEKNF